MSWVMPEIVVRKVIQEGIEGLRADKNAFLDLFSQYATDELADDYGSDYIEKIWTWFTTTKLPVVQAWSLNAQLVPCYSIHLANETEDESKAAMGDYAGIFDDSSETGTGVFTVMVDIGIHANKAGDHVLWMYYIASYVLFKYKLNAERLGLKLHTYSASDYRKEAQYMTENVWTRWIRFKCTTENFWSGQGLGEFDNVNLDHTVQNPEASDIAASLDVDISQVDTTANQGLKASRQGDVDGEEDLNI